MTKFSVSRATASATITLIHVSVMRHVDHFLARNVGQHSGKTQGEVSWDLKDLSADFSTNERTSSSIDGDLLKIIEGLINNKLPKE